MLKINAVFGPTIQGEGPTQGKHVMFLRLAFCNLSCTWCDTKYTWDWQHYDKTKEVKEVDNDILLKQLESPCKAVVISGGEPLLQQRQLLTLVGGLKKLNYWVEVETNGTVVPDRLFLELVNQVNCSPKLSNSGDSKERRIKSKALTTLVASPKVFFKFVVSGENDIDEVWDYVNDFAIPRHRVYLMPLGKTQGELCTTVELTQKMAQHYGFNYSSRLHVELWGETRNV